MTPWPRPEEVLERTIQAGVALEILARRDIPDVVERLARWYPDIAVGSESAHLDPEFLEAHATLAGEREDAALFAAVARADAELVGFASAEYDAMARVLRPRLVVVAPGRRASGVAELLGPQLLEAVARRVGAELVLTTTTLRHPHGQRLLERAGYTLCGIIPAFDRDQIAPGVVKRVDEAMYAKVLVGRDAISAPPAGGLGPRVAALYDLLFGGGGATG